MQQPDRRVPKTSEADRETEKVIQKRKEKSKTICVVQSVKSHQQDAAGADADGGVGRITKTEPVAGFGSRRENMRMKE